MLALVAVNTSDCRAEAAADTADALLAELKYGFRYDPMKWVETNTSPEAAQLRTFVLKTPQPGDGELLKKEIDRIFAKQKEDGSIGKDTHGLLARAIEFGCPVDRPEVRRAADFIAKSKLDEDGALGIYRLRALCMSGRYHAELRDASLRILAERCKEGVRGGCPWSPQVHLEALWAGRKFVDMKAALDAGLAWLGQGLNAAGCLGGNHPWEILALAGEVDDHRGKRIVEKMVPFILRSQNPNGGFGGIGGEWWPQSLGEQSFVVLRPLIRHNLLGRLRELPPLPADWKVVRSIPAPEGQVWALAWDGARFWTGRKNTREAVALSAQDGRVLKRVRIPQPLKFHGWWDDPMGLAWLNGTLVVSNQRSTQARPGTWRRSTIAKSFPSCRIASQWTRLPSSRESSCGRTERPSTTCLLTRWSWARGTELFRLLRTSRLEISRALIPLTPRS